MEQIHSIGIAGLQVVETPDKIRTVLGSCIGIALFDRVAKKGGLAHVILPSSENGKGDRGKFADTAVDLLIEQALEAGCEKKRLAAKIAGGACMFGTENEDGIGPRNTVAVKERLVHHAVRLVAEDVGGRKGRKMMLDPATGQVRVEIIGEEPRIL